MGRLYSPAILAGEQQPGYPGRKTVLTMAIALPIFMLLALVLLGGLAAAVFGIVYAIVNKRPGVALGSVIVPVAAFFAVVLVAMLYSPSQTMVHVAEVAPAHVHWAAQPSMPAMPPMPPMPPMPQFDSGDRGEFNGARIALLIAICIIVAALFGKRSGNECRRSFRWKTPIIGLVVLLMLGLLRMR